MSASMKMLYGPPGTGKTWKAAREAVRAVDPVRYAAALASADPDRELQSAHRSLVNEGRILWVTFHAGYSYEDFVEGYRPGLDGGRLVYRVLDGPFKRICEQVRRKSDLQVGDHLDSASGRTTYEVIDVDPGGWLLRVIANRSDEVSESLDKYVPRRVIQTLLEKGFTPEIFSIAGSKLYDLPAAGINAADGDLPRLEEGETATRRKGSTLRRVIGARTGILSSSDFSNAAHSGAVMRRLQQLRAEAERGGAVALVIDEFNRADPSRVFGELLTLLELDKREGAPEERKVWLPHSQSLFSVPQEVSVIGTMNTVDKSLAPVDFAMRRRFRFEYVGAEPDLLADVAGVSLPQFLRTVNARLGALLGTGYEIGHAFFLPRKLEEVSTRMEWSGQADTSLRSLAYVIRSSVLPTIVEYFHEDWSKIRAVLGDTVVAGRRDSLLDLPDADDAFFERLPDDYERVDGRVAYYARWWNPEDPTWDSARFNGFIAAIASGA